MTFEEHFTILTYPELSIDKQVSMQIALAKEYARGYYDAALSAKELKEEVTFLLELDLKELEIYEKYEYCILYKDTIENIEYIPIHKLY